MPIGQLSEIIPQKPKGRLLAMDIGTKTIGLAVSDPPQKIATSLKTLYRKKFTKDILILEDIIKDYEICGYILGYPVNMDGSEGAKTQSIKHFAYEMANHPDIFGDNPWIAFYDERLSTQSVDEFLVNSVDMTRKKRAKVIDSLAAQKFLQEALNSREMHHTA